MNTQIDSNSNTANPAGEVTLKPAAPDPEGDLARDLLSRAREAASKRAPTLVEHGDPSELRGEKRD
jgi:hypothetical protein